MSNSLKAVLGPLAFFLLVILGVCSIASSQTATTGGIIGTVKDQQGAVIPGAAVKGINLGTNEARSVVTTSSGEYSLPLLPVGTYKVEVTAAGFATLVRSPINVRVTEKVTVDAVLQVRSVTDTITVNEQAEMVQHASPTLGGVVEPTTILNLPLSTRNYTQIMTLSTGVSTSVPNAGSMGLNSIELSSQGSRASDNSVQINGADAMNVFTNTMGSYVGTQGIAVPAPDTLEEFKVQTALYNASTGRNAGANIAVVTKSGTNDLHGSAYEFFRNDALNANPFFFNRAGLDRPVLKQNQFGGAVGGPIVKNKLFFFGSFQSTIQRNGMSPDSQSTAFLPPLTDDRSAASLGRIFGGQKAFAAFVPGGLGTAVAEDGSNINPVALKLLNLKLDSGQYLIPTPPVPGAPTQFSGNGQFKENQFNANIDHHFGANNRLSGKYFDSRQTSYFPLYRDIKSNVLPGFGANVEGRNHNLAVSYNHIFSPALIADARFGYTRTVGLVDGEEPVKAADVGMTLPSPLVTLPWTQVLGQFQIGATHNAQQGVETNMYSYGYSMSWVKGRHSVQFGTELKRHRSFAFDPVTRHSDLIFLDFASLLLGQAAGANGAPFSHVAGIVTFAGKFERDFQAWDLGSYVQDDFRISPRLTLTIGLRHEFFGALTDAEGKNSNFDFRQALPETPAVGTVSGYVVGEDTPGTLPAEVVRADNNSLRDSRSLKNFGPRVGFAFQPIEGFSRLVLRGGYGIYFSRRSGIGLFQNVLAPPFSFFEAAVLTPGSTATFENPLPPILPDSAFPLFIPRTAASQQSINSQDPTTGDPYVQHYSLNVQYEFKPNYLWEIGFVGTKGTHLIGNPNVNQALLASSENPVHGVTTNTIQNMALRVPYQGLSSRAAQYTGGFDSIYRSLQTSLTKRFSQGLQFTAAYTFAKSIDNLGQGEGVFLSTGGVSGDQHDYGQARGVSSYDRKHRFVSSVIYQTPRVNQGSKFVRGLLENWQFAALVTFQSGLPVTVVDTSAATIYGVDSSRAQFAPGLSGQDAALDGSVTSRLSQYFNTAAFIIAPAIGNGTGFGNSGRGILRGPDQRNIDLALMRHFRVSERTGLDFRAEAFNFTNTPSFSNPDTNRAAPASFGVISATTINPRILQFALKVTF